VFPDLLAFTDEINNFHKGIPNSIRFNKVLQNRKVECIY